MQHGSIRNSKNRQENILKQKKSKNHAHTTRTSILRELKHLYKTTKTKHKIII